MAKAQKVPYNIASSSLADFKQLALLGEGAYSAVYKVLRLADREIYALKKVKLPSLSDKEKQNALNEVRLLASIRHDAIISYKEAFYDDKTRCLCIVTEYADSGDLFQLITKHQNAKKHIPEVDVWRYIHGMCHGLKALHDMRILHRDLKCANVFLNASGNEIHAKLGDFNVSKVAKRGLCMTQTGTPYYASPEVWRDMPYDAKSDMWSIGCVLYEMVALRPPFRAEDMEGLYRKVLRGLYPRIPAQYSHDLSEVIGVLLQVNPRHRPSIEQLIQMPVMRRHATEFAECRAVNDLLQTIKLPKNVIDLSTCLPKPQYDLDFGPYEDGGVPPSQESAGDVAGGTRARRNVGGRGNLGQPQQQPPPPPLPSDVDTSRGGAETYQDSLDAYLSPQAQENFVQQGGAATIDLQPRQAPRAGQDSLDDYLTQKNRLAQPRRPSVGTRGADSEADQDSVLGAAAQLRESANPRGLRGLARHDQGPLGQQQQQQQQQPQQQQQQADSGAGRGGEYGGGRGVPQPQYNAYPGLPAPVPRYGGEYAPDPDPRVRASPAPSSHAGRPPPGMYGGREQYRHPRGNHHSSHQRQPMASYARPQYALSSANAVPPQPAARAPSGGGGGLRLPRIFSKAGQG
jgi:serine/threonine protein kinase